MIENFLKQIVKKVFELQKEYEDTVWFSHSDDDKYNYIAKRLKEEL